MPRRIRDAPPEEAAQAFRRRLGNHVDPAVPDEPLLVFGDPAPDSDEVTGGSQVLPARVRWRTPRAVAILLAAATAIAGAGFAWQAAQEQSSFESLPSSATAVGAGSGREEPPATSAGAVVVVHVAGAVQRPGVVTLPEGSRVFQAIEAAGGAAADAGLGVLNLAEVVTDGAKITVPVEGAEAGMGPASGQDPVQGAGSGTDGAKVNINTASVEELGTLPRVGPVMAQRIVDWRKDHGPFTSVEELDAIEGIGPKLMESLTNLVTVQGG